MTKILLLNLQLLLKGLIEGEIDPENIPIMAQFNLEHVERVLAEIEADEDREAVLAPLLPFTGRA